MSLSVSLGRLYRWGSAYPSSPGSNRCDFMLAFAFEDFIVQPMLLKPVLLLALAAVVFATDEDRQNEKTPVTFFTHEGLGGDRVKCTGGDTYDRCYNVDNVAGLSSLYYTNRDPYNEHFSLTLYTGGACSGLYDRWSFEVPKHYKGFYIEKFHSVNDKVRSFKFHAGLTTNVKKGFWPGIGETYYNNACMYDADWSTSRRSMPPLSESVRG
ncbi:hypothetical protein BGZ96_011263 [Linnemannia gamsii]|uniref:Uncharacterized protein n=1 Tax=Linnemannia gamsii TaxID=64522 RepID=A0ABQ7JSP6_9FUNG|nr:hypothetical protein BGZ96_011263 [Linnemannia gamsii]